MAGKIWGKLFREIDDALEMGLFATPKRAPGGRARGMTITKRPVAVHPDVLNEKGKPLERVFHGTSSPVDYASPRPMPGRDVGLHVTDTPIVSDYYAFHTPPKRKRGMSLAGPRTYPMLMDKGNSFDYPIDPDHWTDPQHVARLGWEFVGDVDSAFQKSRNWDDVMYDLEKGVPTEKAFRNWGVDSVVYPHHNPYDRFKDGGMATMVFDPSRVVPQYSPVGQAMSRVRGVLDRGRGAEAPSADEINEALGYSSWNTNDDWMKALTNPEFKALNDKINTLQATVNAQQYSPELQFSWQKGYTPDDIEAMKRMIEEMREQAKDMW